MRVLFFEKGVKDTPNHLVVFQVDEAEQLLRGQKSAQDGDTVTTMVLGAWAHEHAKWTPRNGLRGGAGDLEMML